MQAARRPAAARARGAALGAVAARRGCRPRGLHAARRLRARGAAGRRALASGHPRARGRDASGRRAAGLERARGLALDRRSLRRASSGRRSARSSTGEAGRIAVLDLLRARTRRFEVVFLLGLEEGSLPRRGHESPFLGDDARRELDERSRARLTRPDQVARDRYLFYTACTRASRRLYLVREAATDEGSPREPSPFWDEVQAVFPKDDVARWTRRRPLSDAHLAARRGADRTRASARCRAFVPPMTASRPTRSRRRTAGTDGSPARCARSTGRLA